jgi:hypothetical protein
MNQTPNPFMVVASGNEPLSSGAYLAEFVSVTPFSNDKIQDRWRWVWRVTTGSQSGRDATALTDQKLTPQTHSGRLVSGMAGRSLVAGEDVSALLDSFKGKRFMVTVQAGPKGGKPSVQTVFFPPEM